MKQSDRTIFQKPLSGLKCYQDISPIEKMKLPLEKRADLPKLSNIFA